MADEEKEETSSNSYMVLILAGLSAGVLYCLHSVGQNQRPVQNNSFFRSTLGNSNDLVNAAANIKAGAIKVAEDINDTCSNLRKSA